MNRPDTHTGSLMRREAAGETVTDLFERFLEIEPELYQREIDGFCYWHYIRFHVFTDSIAGRGWIAAADIRRHTSAARIVSLAAALIVNAFRRNVERDTARADVLFVVTSQAVRHRGRRINPYTDILRRNCGLPVSVWEEPMRWAHAPSDQNDGLHYLDMLHLKAFAKSLLYGFGKKAVQKEAEYLQRFFADRNIELQLSRLIFLLARAVKLHLYFSGPVRRLLEKKRVKVIVMVNHYDPVKMVITQAAADLGIYVTELQHGSMGRYNIGYNFGPAGKPATLPKEIWTFGPFWNKTARIVHAGVTLRAMGSPYVEQRAADIQGENGHEKTRVLIISQWTVASRLAAAAVTMAEKLDPEKYEILYKLHPGEYRIWRSVYSREFLDSPVSVIGDGDLYCLFRDSDVIVGVYSTALIESLWFGKPLILLHTYGIHFFQDLIHRGIVSEAAGAEDILTLVQDGDFLRQRQYEVEEFWSAGSLEHMRQRLEFLVQQHEGIGS